MWIDSHAHLNDEAYSEDLEDILNAAREVGTAAIIVVGFDLPSSIRAVELAAQHDMIWAAVGIHPHDAKIWDCGVEAELRQLLEKPKVIAVGEIGLDYHYDYSPREAQQQAFKEQLALAKQYNKPVIIHSREANQDTMTILTNDNIGDAGGVMHCFSGSRETAMECLRLGLYISFAGPLTFPNAVKLRETAESIPLDRVLIETDAPYLTPVPFRGRRNEPARVGLVGAKLAEIKGLPPEQIMAATVANTRKLFGIS